MGEILGVPVPLNDLGRDRGRLQAELPAHVRFYGGIDEGVGPDRPGKLAVTDDLAGPEDAALVSFYLLVPQGHLKPESDRLGVYAVRPPYHHGFFVL